ncbi:ABC transporter substrate-binding protein [Nocardia fusca]|uniref:ABC transporter substrate-binding protein n=1 Tax=Nocardia fusca TaxID=941183 RepID=A0ABV3F3U2_9NOCA
MMIRRCCLLVAALVCLASLLTACSGANREKPAGNVPVPGGTARIVQITEPRSLDPATLSNQWVLNAMLGNALFGTLMINDPETGELRFTMAQSFATRDGGATFELTLRPDLRFSDGSPLDAAAVKYNWDRIKDPANGSAYLQEASMVVATEVVDSTRLAVTMAEPVPNFAEAVYGQVVELRRTNDFDMTTSSANFADPEPALWSVFHRNSRRNLSGIADAELSRALQDGRTGTTSRQRADAYRRVQERLNALVPVIFQVSNEPSVVTRRNVGGVVQYAYGSLLPEELWVEN